MSKFTRKPLEDDDITERLRAHTSHIPLVVPQPPMPPAAQQTRQRAPKTVQVNFNASEAMARIIAEEAAKMGSTRRYFAQLMKAQGHPIPDADLNPLMNRRRWD